MKKSNETIGSIIVIVVGLIIIINLLDDCIKGPTKTIDDFDYFKGYVAEGSYLKNVWLATDTTIDIHSFEQRDSILYFEISDSDVLSKLGSVRYNPDHIVEVWYEKSYYSSRRNFPSSNLPFIRQIALDGDIILPLDENRMWKGFIIISIPILAIIIYLISGFIKNAKDKPPT